ncbi:hypothetical protein [Mastigocladopsis repens]|uniref:hypothetical protein n=1 Tax=Mastigocladopsis repens TaxID=221287 RepID=UPI00037FCBE2|nr:hypothetical protein [Mastigocladopsis repens]
MPARQSILLLILSVLIALPVGVARAEIDVDHGESRVTITDYDGIKIDRDDDDNDTSYPYRSRYRRSTRVRAPQSTIQRLRNLKYPRTTRSVRSCRGRSVTQQRTINSSSGTGNNRTYSSMTTTICR